MLKSKFDNFLAKQAIEAGAKIKLNTKVKNIKRNETGITAITDKEKFQALEASEIFVLPSEWEAFGMCTAEAMVKQNAPVSTRTEGGRHLIKDGENGYLFDFEDLEELREKLSKLLTNKSLRIKMQKANKELVKQFSNVRLAEEYEKVYKKNIKGDYFMWGEKYLVFIQIIVSLVLLVLGIADKFISINI